MSNYRTLYSLTVEHGYFDNGTCRALRCRISPRGADLWRRRGLLFRQSGPNAWTVLYDSDGAGVDTSSDTLLLEMDITDPAFVLYTRWDGFRPTSAYGLELPAVSGTVEAAQSIRETAPKRGIGEGFCTVRIRLTDGLFRAAQDGTPESCTLVFHAPEHRWEYLLETHTDGTYGTEDLLIEEYGGKLTFPPPEPVTEYGRRMLRTVSSETVPMHERYAYRLKLTAGGNTSRRRVLLKSLPLPQAGAYLDAAPGLLRQVCRL